MNKLNYCLGFSYCNDGRILLILKNRPEFMKGLYNAIGGHIEDGETPLDALVREFKEETSIITFHSQWRKFSTVKFSNEREDITLNCFTLMRSIQESEIDYKATDEKLKLIPDYKLDEFVLVRNLQWLIPLSTDQRIVCSEITSK